MTSATYELTRATRPRAADNAAERIADQHSLRRGSLIFQDVTDVGGSPDSEGEEGGEEADSSDEAAGTGVAEITWEVPSGFTVADEPILDERLVG